MTTPPDRPASPVTDDRSRAIRAGFARLATGVAVITTLDDGRPHGCTGMAWAEHAAPPLLLTTLRTGGRTRELVGAVRRFGVNVLSEEQRAHTARFAARSAEPGARFAGVPFSPGPTLGVPLLDGCVASFECEVTDIHPFGGHDIVVGRVTWASAAGEGRPALYYDGRLWGLREAGA
jgi:3-hydroxy-9,10-secoandrosta-1,3,5(10)-triene-9,17-dione monooxygenase reductase component